jgi:hypothetical protein
MSTLVDRLRSLFRHDQPRPLADPDTEDDPLTQKERELSRRAEALEQLAEAIRGDHEDDAGAR